MLGAVEEHGAWYSPNKGSQLIRISFGVFLGILLMASSAHASYSVCRDPQTGQEDIACGNAPCPAGMSRVQWYAGDHPRCGGAGGGGPDLVGTCEDIKDMCTAGWRSGHKTNWCTAKGFDGVLNYGGPYGKGGICYKGGKEDCRKSVPNNFYPGNCPGHPK